MAYWVVGGGSGPDATGRGTFIPGGKNGNMSMKRRVEYSDGGNGHYGSGYDYGHDVSKRARLEDWPVVMNHHYQPPHHIGAHQHHHYYQSSHGQRQSHNSSPNCCDHGPPLTTNSIPVRNLAFLVIREGTPTPKPRPPMHPLSTSSCSMERTESGLSVSSDTTNYYDDSSESLHLLSDLAAARLVRKHVSQYRPDSQPERILKSLISPKHDFPLDNDALRSIFSAANELFFANRLTRRVAWDWSHQSSEQYAYHIVGTTALRRSLKLGGYETLIVLSSPILKDTKYNRRLLISTFLHEMIHSFLFVTCGLKARAHGGHTEGFRQIAETIDMWVGKEYLRLSDMEADLERFRGDDSAAGRGQTEWRPCQDGDYYLAEPRQRSRNTGQDEWQWHGQEDFGHAEPSLGPHHTFHHSR